MFRFVFALAVFFGLGAHAEYRTYGRVQLQGLSRDSGSLNPPGLTDVMICNLEDSNSFLSVLAGPDEHYPAARKLERLVVLRVDTQSRRNHWIFVTQAYRTHSPTGALLTRSYDLGVTGWVHDGYLCDFRTL